MVLCGKTRTESENLCSRAINYLFYFGKSLYLFETQFFHLQNEDAIHTKHSFSALKLQIFVNT